MVLEGNINAVLYQKNVLRDFLIKLVIKFNTNECKFADCLT